MALAGTMVPAVLFRKFVTFVTFVMVVMLVMVVTRGPFTALR